MPAYRYVKTTTKDGDSPEHADVTFVTEGNRDALDESMAKMGFAFSHVIDSPRKKAAPIAFPGAVVPEADPDATPPRGHAVAELIRSDDARGFGAGPALRDDDQGRAFAKVRTRGVLSGKDALSAALGDATSDSLKVLHTTELAAPEAATRSAFATDQFTAKASQQLASAWSRTPPSAVLTLAIVAAFVTHAKVVQSGFIDDDFVRAWHAVTTPTWAFVTERFGGLFVGTYELGWLASQKLLGLDAEWTFRFVFLSHCVNVALVYGVARALSGRSAVGAVAATVWGMTPGFQSTLQSLSAYGAVLATMTISWALLELARAAEAYRPPKIAALVRANVALILAAGTMPGAFLAGLVSPALAFTILPRESARGRSALSLLPAAIVSAVPALSFFRGASASVQHPFVVVRLFFESIAYGIGMTAAAPLATIHANARGVGLFSGPSYGFALVVSGIVAILVVGFFVFRLVRGEPEERLELTGLLLLGMVLYAGVAVSRGGLLVTKSVEWIAARSPQHYVANVPFVLAAAAAAARLRVPASFFTRLRVAALAAFALTLVLVNGSVSRSTHAQRPERSARVTAALEDVITDLIDRVPESDVVYIQNEDFPPVLRARTRGAPAERFPGIGAYWAIAHGPFVASLPPSASASAAPPAPSGSAAAEGAEGRPAKPPADLVDRPVRFVVMDPRLLASIAAHAPPGVAGFFVSPTVPAKERAEVLALGAADPDNVEKLEAVKRALGRMNDL